MQVARSWLTVKVLNRNIVRTIAVNSATVNSVESKQQSKPWQEIPGPSSLPIIGQLRHFIPGGEFSDTKTFFYLLNDKFGDIVRLDAMFGRPANIFVYDAESCATILRSENSMPVRPGFDSLEYYRKHHNKTKEQALKPTGLITDHGDNWRQFRTKVNPVMLQPKTIKLYSSVLDEVAEDICKTCFNYRMKSKRNEKNMLEGEFDVEMNLWALESIAVVALGQRLNCFDPNLSEDSPARRLIQCVHDFFLLANELDFKPSLWRYFSTPTFKKAMKCYAEQDRLAKYFVKKAIKDLESKPKSEDEKGVLEKLLEIDEEVAIIMANDMLFAGVDTAATTITATLFLLATNPEKQDTLREEVLSGTDQKTYLKACIKEGLRLMPVVGGNLRKTTKEYNLLGYHIPKDMNMILCHQALSLKESQYQRAKEYLPERWTDKSAPYYYGHAHPFAYSPFGFGVRSCIGRRIADLEIETFLAKVIKNFKVEWFGPPIKVNPSSLNYLVGPFNFVFKDV